MKKKQFKESLITTKGCAIGWVSIVLSLIVYWGFGRHTESGMLATFRLSSVKDSIKIPNLVLDVKYLSFVISVILLLIGIVGVAKGINRYKNLIIVTIFFLTTFAFLGWAAAGKSFSLIGMLSATLLSSVPITFGALSGLLCERSGIINIAIEGMLLFSAFCGAVFGSIFGLWIGLLAAIFAGGLIGWILGVLTIRYNIDQVILGFVITTFVIGLTTFLSARLLTRLPEINSTEIFNTIKIPILSDIPIIGVVLFQNNILVYILFILVIFLEFTLFRTRWGLRTRAIGEHPEAADTTGVNVFRLRYLNVIIAGMVAGLGGAYLTIGTVGRFVHVMTAGKGYIGLAAMILGGYNPLGALASGLLFGFADSLQQKLAILNTPIPSEFLLSAPYIVTVIVVAGFVGRVRPPKASGKPYIKH